MVTGSWSVNEARASNDETLNCVMIELDYDASRPDGLT